MAKTLEQLDGARSINPFAGNAGTADYVRGSASRAKLIGFVQEQIESPNPQKIRVVEGMGYRVYSAEQLREIKRLPPEEKYPATFEIILDVLNADYIYVEEAQPAQALRSCLTLNSVSSEGISKSRHHSSRKRFLNF